jgi:sugar lactone lactonase YvrE
MADLHELVRDVDFGEGLRWHDHRLWYSDFFQHTVFAVTTSGEREAMLAIDDQPSGLGWLPDGRLLVVSMHARKVLRHEPDGSLVTHADLAGLAAGPGNDMVVAADGTAYVGNFGFDVYAGEEYATADLVRVTPDGHATVAAEGFAFPNGSVITPDGSTLIVGESFALQYTAFTIAPDGSLSDRRVWAALDGVSPDGCTLDAEGGIWTANAAAGHGGGAGEVVRIVEGGEITHRIATPQTAYACALGGDDGTTLFVTTAPGAMHDEVAGKKLGVIHAVEVAVPHAGRP